MKRVLTGMLVVLFLAGCVGTPETQMPSPVDSKSPPSTQPSKMVPSPSIVKTPMPTATPVPTKAPATPEPSPSAAYPEELCILNADNQGDKSDGLTTVSSGNTVYSRDDESIDEAEYDTAESYYFSLVYKSDLKTSKNVELFNTDGKGVVDFMHLGKDGSLYYTLTDDSILYRYYKGKSAELLNGFTNIIRIDDNYVFYSIHYGSGKSEAADYIKFDTKTGAKTQITKDGAVLKEHYQVAYRIQDDGTYFLITDSVTNKKTTCGIASKLLCPGYGCIYDGNLFVMDFNETKQKYTVLMISITENRILSQFSFNGEMDGYDFYKGKWYYYVSEEDQNETVINERIYVCELATGKTTVLSNMGVKDGNHLLSAHISATGGYLWVYCVSGGDGLCVSYIDKIKLD